MLVLVCVKVCHPWGGQFGHRGWGSPGQCGQVDKGVQDCPDGQVYKSDCWGGEVVTEAKLTNVCQGGRAKMDGLVKVARLSKLVCVFGVAVG